MSGRKLDNERDALSVYFDALLNEDEAQRQLQEEVREQPERPLQEPQPLGPVIAPPVITPAPVEPQLQTETVVESDVAVDVRPEWGRGSFQALLFKVAGLTLAVPLVELSGIQPWEEEAVTPMPGHSPWYLGLAQYREKSVPVVDTAQLVLPEERLARLPMPPGERLGRVVYIDDGHWGLGCDEVAEVITLEPEQVSWRSSRTKRRWLAGTVIEQMCALIDPPVFAEMLATGLADEPGAEDSDEDRPLL